MPTPTQHIETPRLALVPVAREHASALFGLMRDPRVSRYLAWAPHTTVDETTALVDALMAAHERGAGYHWVIVHDGLVIGLISLIDVQRTHRLWAVHRAEIAYWIAPERQGAGFATEATGAVVERAFEDLGLNRLKISHTSANPASGAIPKKLGFRYVGTELQFFKKDGVWHDMNHYELLADDWRERNRQTTT